MDKKTTIVCFGDSLTVCGGAGGTYPDFLQKDLPDCRFVVRGVSGETISGGKKRFHDDVLILRPDILIFELGANDYWLRRQSLRSLLVDYEDMISAARDRGIEVVIASCLGSAYNPREKIDWDKLQLTLDECAAGIASIEHDLVRRYGCFYIPDIQADIRPNGTDPYWIDYCHPSRDGNRLVAQRIKKQLLKAIKKLTPRSKTMILL